LAKNCGPMPAEPDLTDDAALGGRLRLLQPRRGHRFGHDAILLAVATPARAGDRIADLGAGVGTAGLALAARIDGARVTLVEIDARLAALARENAARNGLGERVDAVTLDVAAPADAFAVAGLAAESCDIVIMNPPFHDTGKLQASPDACRRRAHEIEAGKLTDWVGAARRLLRPGGVLTLIFRADGLPALIDLVDGFGGVAVMPVHPKPGAAAIRVLLAGVKGSRAPFTIREGLVLAGSDGTPTAQTEAILRHGHALDLVER
jgi:tRNA1(Val) A37 N6-methylase TrmN6